MQLNMTKSMYNVVSTNQKYVDAHNVHGYDKVFLV